MDSISTFSLSPTSSMFLAYYITETSKYLSVRDPERNPFVTYLLPFAFKYDIVLHAILALGGSHMALKHKSSDIAAQAWKYYGNVLQMLRKEISRGPKDTVHSLQVLLVLLLLIATEVGSFRDSCSRINHHFFQSYGYFFLALCSCWWSHGSSDSNIKFTSPFSIMSMFFAQVHAFLY
jgi:hypothetical protein